METAELAEEVEGAGLGERWRSVRRTEEGEAGGGDGGEGEAAGGLLWWEEVGEEGHQEFLAWREAGEEELRRGLGTEEGEGGLPGPLWMGEEEEGGELSCVGAEEEGGGRHEREVEGGPASSARSSLPPRLLSSR